MDKRYMDLLQSLAQSTAVSAETVMEYDREHKDEQGLATATLMRDDYQELAIRLSDENYELNKQDAAKLLVGAMIIVNQLQDKISALKKAMTGYQTDLIPKLQAVVDAESDDAAKIIVKEKFVLENKE